MARKRNKIKKSEMPLVVWEIRGGSADAFCVRFSVHKNRAQTHKRGNYPYANCLR